MYTVHQTDTFVAWLLGLRDARAKATILLRLHRARGGNLGDAKSLGDSVSEMRVDVGAGYRLYFTRRGKQVILL